jgi:hypothetical protein
MGHALRSTQLDPELRGVVEWCRTGRHASFLFRCEFLNPRNVNRATAIFEVTLADLLPNAAYRRVLEAAGFVLPVDPEAPPCGYWLRVRKRPPACLAAAQPPVRGSSEGKQ